ncbi:hypothetical protein ACFLYU_03065 [Candidatus Dependentiae bacterium]
MKASCYKASLLTLAVLNFSIYPIGKNAPNKRRQSRQKPNQNAQNLTHQPTHQQVQQQQRQQMCNILGYASNIFSNFVHMVSKPNDKDNIGAQVGNMAQNIFHIVAEASSNKNKSKLNNKNILDYLASNKFKEDLTQEILTTLGQIKDS